MRVWIATDWYGTMVFTTKPKLIDNGNGYKEWYGNRCSILESLIPKEFKHEDEEIIEAEVTLTIP